MSADQNSDHEKFLKQAIALGQRSCAQGHGGPFGAVVVKGGKVIAEGFNSVLSLKDPTAHAEVQAIRAACAALQSFQLEDCEVYTSCEPCPMCLGALYWARPRKIYYAASRQEAAEAGFDDSFIYDELGKDPAVRQLKLTRLLAREGQEAFEIWNNKSDRVAY